MPTTILVIDDDPDMLHLVATTLAEAGYHAVPSEDPTRIEALALEHDADALVLDVVMPDVSGHTVLRGLRENPHTGGLPVLLLSARADGRDRVDGLRLGADDFLGKPFEPEELVLRVERLVARPAAATTPRSTLGLERSLRSGKVEGRIVLGRYQALELIGEGGTGAVFRGWDPRLKRPVALKTLSTQDDAKRRSSEEIAKLLREAATIARFNHPSIVTVYDVGEGPDLAFIAMEFVDGTSLGSYLEASGPLPPRLAGGLTAGVAAGLAAAHVRGVVHRDVKPGNVLLGTDGSVKVSDFGFAALASSLRRNRGEVIGTPGYLPPEILHGETYGPAGDIYSLGALLYRALTGRLPVEGTTWPQLLQATLAGPDLDLRAACPDLDPGLEALCVDLLASDPEQRVADGGEALARLGALGITAADWRIDEATLARAVPDRERTLEPL